VCRTWYRERLLPRFRDHLLDVDRAVAEAAAAGRWAHPAAHDALIAATARVHRLILVTCNVTDFADTGVPVINPGIP